MELFQRALLRHCKQMLARYTKDHDEQIQETGVFDVEIRLYKLMDIHPLGMCLRWFQRNELDDSFFLLFGYDVKRVNGDPYM